jgi:Cof subfamily protein (haloacid dehalogenase superfamily)
MYKIIASDLDETLLNDDHVVPRRNVDAIRAARKMGVRFVPTTGRGYTSVQGTLDELGLRDAADEYVISFNGGVVVENRGLRILSTDVLPFCVADELYRRGRAYDDVCTHVYTLDTVWVHNYNQYERDYVRGRMNVVETNASTLDFLRDQPIIKVIYMNLDRPYLERIRLDLGEVVNRVDVSFSASRYMEFNARGVNKGAGLMALAERLGVAPHEVMAIGDSLNDLSMIKAAGLGVGVANVADDTRPACDYVCEADNNAGAVGEAIERFVLRG